MLATLHDPVSTVDLERPPVPTALPGGEDREGVHVVRLGGYPDAKNGVAYEHALAAALALRPGDRGLVVDLRAAGDPSFDQLDRMETVWSRTPFAAHALDEPLALTAIAQRYFLGFPPETGTTSADYREGRATVEPVRTIPPAPDARAVRIAFVVDRTAYVPNEALALAGAGRAAIFSSDGVAGIAPGDVDLLEPGAGLRVVLRISGPIAAPWSHPGDLDAAIAWAQAKRALPPVPAPPTAIPVTVRFAASALPDEAHRVLAAFRMWGTIAYLDPYRSLMRDDWDAALAHALDDLRSATTPLAYDLALMRMYAHVGDTHGFISAPALTEAYAATPALLARDVAGRPTIVRVDPVAAKRDGFAVGDVIEAVDGEGAGARAARLRPYLAASTEQSMRELLDTAVGIPSLLAGPAGSVATLRVRGADGRERVVRTPRRPLNGALQARTRPVVEVLPGNVGYVDLQRLTAHDVDATLARLAHTRALLFDLRGYPQNTFVPLGQRLAARTAAAALFRTPVRRLPLDGDTGMIAYGDEWRSFAQQIVPSPPRSAQPVVVILDARAISQSEHTALFLAAAAHARFVGQPTAGADGDVTTLLLPGGVRASFSGQSVSHPDGTPLQRVGIQPDVRVAPTLRGVRSGEDELLAAGLREALRVAHADDATVRGALAEERARERSDAAARDKPPPPPALAPPGAPPLPDAFAAHGDGYEGGHDPAVRHADGRTIVLRALAGESRASFGSYSEPIPVAAYLGKRVRVSGYLRSAAAGSASFWLRVTGPNGMLEGFDNMGDRALTATQDWTPFAIVLRVPADAQELIGGLLLQGGGTVWADDLRIDVVDDRVPTTGSL